MPSARLISLVALCIHYSALTIIMHISRTNSKQSYKPSSAVVITELFKLLLSILLAVREKLVELNQQARPMPVLHQTPHMPPISHPKPDREGDEDGVWNEETDQLISDVISRIHNQSQPDVTRANGQRRRSVANSNNVVHSRSNSSTLRLSVRSSPPANSSFAGASLLWSEVCTSLRADIFQKGWWKLSVPAVMFVVQNNLQYVAASNLSVPLFQITYQLKILTTALCSVILLRRKLHKSQWIALLLLGVGVAAVQLHAQSEDHSPSHSNSSNPDEVTALNRKNMNQLLGLVSVVLACLSSGFASVYFERVLKSTPTPSPAGLNTPSNKSPTSTSPAPQNRPPASVWIRNIQLSFFGLLMGALIVSIEGHKDQWATRWNNTLWWWEALDRIPASFKSSNFFAGFSGLVWLVVGFQVLGGLLNALVIQHADNIAKGFATSVSILLSFIASVLLFDFKISLGSLLGSGLVVFSTWLFNISQDRVRHMLQFQWK